MDKLLREGRQSPEFNAYTIEVNLPQFSSNRVSHIYDDFLISDDVPKGQFELLPPRSDGEHDYAPLIPRRQLWKHNGQGGKLGQYSGPTDITFNHVQQRFIVADTHNYRLQVLSLQGKPLNVIGQGILYPKGLVIDHIGSCFIANSIQCGPNVSVLNSDGYLIASWGQSILAQPKGIAVTHHHHLVVSDETNNTITSFTPEGKVIVPKFGTIKKKCKLCQPGQIVVDSKNRIIVSDKGNDSVKIFDVNGKMLKEFSPRPPATTNKTKTLYLQEGISVDKSDNILVALFYDHIIAQFSPDGEFMGHMFTEADGLRYPVGIQAGMHNMAITESNQLKQHASVKLLSFAWMSTWWYLNLAM